MLETLSEYKIKNTNIDTDPIYITYTGYHLASITSRLESYSDSNGVKNGNENSMKEESVRYTLLQLTLVYNASTACVMSWIFK